MHSAAFLASTMLGACIDPEARFDAFADRLPSAAVGAGGRAADAPDGSVGTCPPTPGNLDGPHLLTLSISIAPTTPILALLELRTAEFMGSVGVAFDAQPLSAADRMTAVGDPISAGPFVVSGDGGFRASIAGLNILGVANPITGSDISADLVLIGNLCGPPAALCGQLEGTVTAPLDLSLTGSTFTLVPVDGTQALPEPPPINCAGDRADPL
jgi:hypothetical protein